MTHDFGEGNHVVNVADRLPNGLKLAQDVDIHIFATLNGNDFIINLWVETAEDTDEVEVVLDRAFYPDQHIPHFEISYSELLRWNYNPISEQGQATFAFLLNEAIVLEDHEDYLRIGVKLCGDWFLEIFHGRMESLSIILFVG